MHINIKLPTTDMITTPSNIYSDNNIYSIFYQNLFIKSTLLLTINSSFINILTLNLVTKKIYYEQKIKTK
jgi:hypothetical protein